jgi:hypothetical protein
MPKRRSNLLFLAAVRADESMDGAIVSRIQGKTGGLFEPGQVIMSLKA